MADNQIWARLTPKYRQNVLDIVCHLANQDPQVSMTLADLAVHSDYSPGPGSTLVKECLRACWETNSKNIMDLLEKHPGAVSFTLARKSAGWWNLTIEVANA